MAVSQGKSPKKNPSQKKANAGDRTTRYIAIGMVVFVLATAGIFAFMNNQASKKLTIPSSVSKADGYAIVVNPSAPVRVDFWEDFQCPNCRNFEAVSNAYFDDLVKAKKIKAVYHPMSFLGPESVLAAQAAACTADEGKFVQMHTMLFANQPSSENSGAWTNDVLNWTQKVEDDASKKGVSSTPTLFVNGKELDRAHYLDLAALKKDLAAAGVK